MSNDNSPLFAEATQTVQATQELIGRLFAVAEPGAVFGAPITRGERTVITATELTISMGAGFGMGGGPAEEGDNQGSGGGGGGGGWSAGRPIAAIIVEPEGVRVEPILDPTKIAIAFFTTLGAMWLAWTQLRKAARG